MFRQRSSSCYSATLPHKRPVLMVLAKPPAAMVAVHKQQAQGVRCQPGQTASFVPPVGLAECQCMGGRVARQPQYSRAVLSNCISSRANFARASVITERAKFPIPRSCKSIIWAVESTSSWRLPLWAAEISRIGDPSTGIRQHEPMFCRLSPSGTYNIQYFHTAISVLASQSLSSRRNPVQMSGIHSKPNDRQRTSRINLLGRKFEIVLRVFAPPIVPWGRGRPAPPARYPLDGAIRAPRRCRAASG